MPQRAMPVRHAQPDRLDAVVVADLAQTAAALGMQRARLEAGFQPRLLPNVVLAGELCFESKLHQHEARVPRQERRASTPSFRAPCPRAYAQGGEAGGKESGAAVPLWIAGSDNEPAEQNEKSDVVNQEMPREATVCNNPNYPNGVSTSLHR